MQNKFFKEYIKKILVWIYLILVIWYFISSSFNLGFTNDKVLERDLLFLVLEICTGIILIIAVVRGFMLKTPS